jgi:SAM-dependent methyltransferase
MATALPAYLPKPITRLARHTLTFGHRLVLTPINRARRRGRPARRLEIGPGPRKLDGFEAMNVTWSPGVDYIGDASRRLPFEDGSFDLVYASHIIEHVAWYQAAATIREWARVLRPGGRLEVWTPDGLKICEAVVRAERDGDRSVIDADAWTLMNPENEPLKWAAGRLFAVGDRRGTINHPNWHRAMFSEGYLRRLFEAAGLVDVETLDPASARGQEYGAINLGVAGTRP